MKKQKLIGLVLVFLILILSANIFSYVNKSYSLWVCPFHYASWIRYVGSVDFLNLFSQDDQWKNARSHVEVFQFYQYEFSDNLSDAEAINVIDKLKAWNIDMALESGSVKAGDYCDGTLNANAIINTINRIELLSGKVKYISMDEPLVMGNVGWPPNEPGCGLQLDQIVDNVLNYINRVKAVHPELIIGSTEAYPHNPATSTYTIQDFIVRFREKAGYEIPFLHLDVDRNHLNNLGWGLTGIKTLGEFCQGRGIEFGVIFIDNIRNATSDQQFYEDTLSWAYDIQNLMGRPEHSIVQSWCDKPDYCLPETSGYTFTRLTRRLFDLYGPANNAQYISDTIPAEMVAGERCTVSVTFRNTGANYWEKATDPLAKSTQLASQNPKNNTIWGLKTIDCYASDKILPGQLKTFTFTLIAPANAGTYSCDWQLVRGGSAWFGKIAAKSVTVSSDNFLPNNPVLISPADNAAVSTTTPTFAWYAVTATPAVDYYQVQINNADGTVRHFSQNLTGTSYTLSTAAQLESGKAYAWYVRAHNAVGLSGWSGRTINISTMSVPANPVLDSPANNSMVYSTMPTFAWYAVTATPAVDYYQVQINNADGSVRHFSQNLTGTSYTLSAAAQLESGKAYAWYVRAHNAAGLSGWSGRTINIAFMIQPPVFPGGCGSISAGYGLGIGQQLNSCNGRFVLAMQNDGNLVLYDNQSGAIWASYTGSSAFGAYMQADGNLVIYTQQGTPLWASNTGNHNGAFLAIQDDGNLVIYDGFTAIWATNTGGR